LRLSQSPGFSKKNWGFESPKNIKKTISKIFPTSLFFSQVGINTTKEKPYPLFFGTQKNGFSGFVFQDNFGSICAFCYGGNKIKRHGFWLCYCN
jgi:hypothetical protein